MIKQHESDLHSSITVNGQDVSVIEGYMPFMGYKTYYRIVGNPDSKNLPLIVIHGGPGGGHDTLEVLDDLSILGDRQLVYYDQIGCGKSYVEGHKEMWHQQTWVDELIALRSHLGLDKCHLLGQSWGGMLIIAYLCDCNPDGICSAVISSGHCSSQLWGQETMRLTKYLPQKYQDAINHAVQTNDFTSKEYLEADKLFATMFEKDAEYPDGPECFNRGFAVGSRDVYNTAWGPNEYTPIGNMSNFEYRDKLHNIKEPCLIVSGTNDVCTPLMGKTMAEGISNSQWDLLAGCKHRCYFEGGQKYKNHVTEWMNSHENS